MLTENWRNFVGNFKIGFFSLKNIKIQKKSKIIDPAEFLPFRQNSGDFFFYHKHADMKEIGVSLGKRPHGHGVDAVW